MENSQPNSRLSPLNVPEIQEVLRQPRAYEDTTYIFWEDFPVHSRLIGRTDEAVISKRRGATPNRVQLALESVVELSTVDLRFTTEEVVRDQSDKNPDIPWSNAHQARPLNELAGVINYIAGETVMVREMKWYGNEYEWVGGVLVYKIEYNEESRYLRARQALRGIDDNTARYNLYLNDPTVMSPHDFTNSSQEKPTGTGEQAFPADATKRNLTLMGRDILGTPEGTLVSLINAAGLLRVEDSTHPTIRYKTMHDMVQFFVSSGYLTRAGSELYRRTDQEFSPKPTGLFPRK
jgi:hypothetical protein